MPALFSLEGREVQDDGIATACIFCGKKTTHINDGGTGWYLGAVVNDQSLTFLYHNDLKCATKAQSLSIFRCACEPDYVESVGEVCHACRRPRGEVLPWDDEAHCKAHAAQGGHLTRKRPDGSCEDCGTF